MAMNDCMKQQKQKKKKFNITSINVKLVNQEYDDFGNENDSYTWGDSTFRQDGFSIDPAFDCGSFPVNRKTR